MLCRDLMKTDVECVSPKTSARDAARRMRERQIGFLPVCDSAGKVVGAVTDRDIAIRLVSENKPSREPIGNIFTAKVVACSPDDDVEDARELMSRHQKSRIMCVDDDGKLQGVISLSDIVELDEEGGAATLRSVSARENGASATL